MTSLSFSAITDDNHHEAFRLQCRCHAFPWSRATFVSCLDGQYFAQQAHLQGRLAGYFVGLNVAGEATLMDIGLDAEFRRKGYGKALLAHFLTECRQRKLHAVWLEVRQSNAAAIKLYNEFGFEVTEIRENYYPKAEGREHAQIMCLKLD